MVLHSGAMTDARSRTPLPALEPPYPDLMTALEAARYLRFSSVLAFKKWARRRAIMSQKRGPKITLWKKADLDEVCALESRCQAAPAHQPPPAASDPTGEPVCPK